MSHLEELLYQYYDWKRYIVRRNINVGRLSHGGWEGELDIVAYHPETDDLIHLEPSVDAHSWEKREFRFKKKFNAGKKYIFKDVFPWLDPSTRLTQIAVLISCAQDRKTLAGGKIVTIDAMMSTIKKEIKAQGVMGKSAIPEQYGLLRTIQMTICGYYRLRD